MEDTAKTIQCIVYLPVVSHEETAKAIQFIVYCPLVLHGDANGRYCQSYPVYCISFFGQI